MIKTLRYGVASFFVAGSAYAGSLVYNAPVDAEIIEEPVGSMGSSGSWIIPLIAIAVIAIIIASSDNDDDDDEPEEDEAPEEEEEEEEEETSGTSSTDGER